ncbi:glycerophosphodiester phosphodiesterase [bacterium]|nr:glycerophosphodiester phosphodiesterase [bacterium]
MKKVLFKTLFVVFSFLLLLPASVRAGQDQEIGTSRWMIDDVLTTDMKPFAIGHRGYGVNLGEVPDNPIENTTKAVRRAFREGVQIVEVDANLTADNVAVVLHDDFLPDLTCINTLTFKEIKKILPEVSSLRQILKVSRTYSVMTESDRPRGQVVVEIKTPTPFCVSLDDEPEAIQALVDAVLDDIRFTRMVDQVTIESFSPEILAKVAMAGEDVANIPRMLAVDVLQLLPLAWIGPMSGYEYTVQVIDKDSHGLAWGEVGVELAPGYILWLFRVPGYYTEEFGGALGNYIRVMSPAETGSSIASLDKRILFMAADPPNPLAAAEIVGAMHYYGFSVLVFTIDNQLEWMFMSEAGVDGMYIDDIPMGLTMEGQ